MTPQEIHDGLKAKFGDAVVEAKLDAPQPWIRIAPNKMKSLCFFLRDDASFQLDYMMCLSGVDYNDGNLGVVYHLFSMVHKHKIVLKANCPKDNPLVQSVSEVWGTANWHEREAYDMFGIQFDGHPDLRRILCPDDYPGFPLRKDFKVPEFYNGMKVPY
ncbi:MAG: NADH-quinone oxidoreductase subunit C [Ignavibacteriales bacterium]|nr:NADH-quinone oxidoreductase subunit C [Ignavibacteriales bacterium]